MNNLKTLELVKFSGCYADDPYNVFEPGEVIVRDTIFTDQYGFAVYDTDINTVRSIINEYYDRQRSGNPVYIEELLDSAGLRFRMVDDSFYDDEDVILIDPYQPDPDAAIITNDEFYDGELYNNVCVWIDPDYSNINDWKTVIILVDTVVDLLHGKKVYKVYSVNNRIPSNKEQYLLIEYGPYIIAEFLSEEERWKM